MKKILLVCGAGMSTSLLVRKMQEADALQEYYIKCCDTMSAQVLLLDYDIFLLAPHIAYMKDDFILKCENAHIPFMVVDTVDYTKMDGEAVLHKVSLVLNEYAKENPFSIVLLHSTGGAMSDLLVMDMKKKRNVEEENWIIESCSIDQFEDNGKTSVVLLEPQMSYEEENIRKKLKNPLVILGVPTRSLYATFNGRKILDYIYQIYEIERKRQKEKMKEGYENI